MDAAGTNPTRLTTNSVLEDEPSFSPDGLRMVYHGSTLGTDGVYITDLTGLHLRLLEPSGDQPDWSSVGNRVVYRSPATGLLTIDTNCNSQGPPCPPTPIPGTLAGDRSPVYSPNGLKIAFARGTGIWVMNTDGSSQLQLTSQDEDWPTWSPDGTQIAFSSRRSGCASWHIYIMSATTGAIVRQLTGVGCPGYDDTKPFWR